MNSVAKSFAISLLLLAAAACGDNKPPPANPESTPTSSEDAGAPAASEGGASDGGAATATAEPPPAPKPAALDLPADAAKFKVKLKGKDTEIEIKKDGTVNTAGKPTHKIAGMELQDKDGKGLAKVDADNNITLADGSAYGKFEGDDLTGNDTSKFSVGDDGISQTDAKGKKTVLAAKAEGVGSAKKATLLVVSFNVWGGKPPAAPKGAAKPADKKAGDKPADKKAGDKPAPKK